MEKNGEYYLYTTFVKPDENARTYVLKSDRPEGPFLLLDVILYLLILWMGLINLVLLRI